MRTSTFNKTRHLSRRSTQNISCVKARRSVKAFHSHTDRDHWIVIRAGAGSRRTISHGPAASCSPESVCRLGHQSPHATELRATRAELRYGACCQGEPSRPAFRRVQQAKTARPSPLQVIGSLASKPPADKDPLTGLLISKDFSYTLLDPKDLKDFTGLGTSEITQRQRVRIGVSWDVVRWHLEGMYGEVEEDVVDGRAVFIVSLCRLLRLSRHHDQ